jgi:hypothetical protein
LKTFSFSLFLKKESLQTLNFSLSTLIFELSTFLFELYPFLLPMNLSIYDQQMQKALAYLEKEFQGLQV